MDASRARALLAGIEPLDAALCRSLHKTNSRAVARRTVARRA
jgi:hypothetical protein